jgi:hypothetical protein
MQHMIQHLVHLCARAHDGSLHALVYIGDLVIVPGTHMTRESRDWSSRGLDVSVFGVFVKIAACSADISQHRVRVYPSRCLSISLSVGLSSNHHSLPLCYHAQQLIELMNAST